LNGSMNWRKNSKHKPRALLIFPSEKGKPLSNDAVFPFPSLTLPVLAAAFPDHYTLHVMDERVSRVRGTEDADIVFLTTLTATAPRAYELAHMFMKRGVPVVMGGVHVTILPAEAQAHATSVVVGEAENLIPTILSDFEKGCLSPLYTNPSFIDLEMVRPPALQLLNWRHRFFISPLQTSRGCPHDCGFCSVPRICGRKIRIKSPAEIEQELKHLSRFRSRRLFVVDDNMTLNKERCLEIIKLFRRFGFRWMAFSNLEVSQDADYLQAMADYGCISLFIGFESINLKKQLSKNRSFKTADAMADAITRIHAHNIGIQGSFVFGFDEDTPDVFQDTVRFIQETGIELPNLCILTPFPGTSLFDALEKEGRILHKDWSCYDMSHVVFSPRAMSAEELQQGYAWALKYMASPTSILARMKRRTSDKLYFLTANFALHRSQTRLARSLWNVNVQTLMQERNLCPC
jgi:radical SAM superfamily enzyme YgiQ (UPF0313 family)